ncbi:MAG: GNAT family N-acetyltransferase [Actinomycetales bacterium]|nr:GNAT family N-acetyltransferase [Actinomycetales bacterium]
MTNSWSVPTLPGEMVTLRPIGARDADGLWVGVNDPEGIRLTGTTATFTREQIDEWAARVADREGRFDWAMTADGEEMLGEIVLNEVDLDARSANLRVATLPARRGRGYGREAIMLVLAFAFADAPEGLGLHRVSLDVLSINPRAAALYQSLGFIVEGRQRDVHLDGDRYCDAILMAMLEDDFLIARSDWR